LFGIIKIPFHMLRDGITACLRTEIEA
jgi:hypothetical protein